MKDKTEVQAELTKWEDGKLSNAEMVADIEKEVAKGQVDPTWLHDAAKEPENKMLRMDQRDHELHEDAKIPELGEDDKKAAVVDAVKIEHKGV